MEVLHNKILSIKELVFLVNQWRLRGDQIVFTNGCFDILHEGHIKVLSESRKQGDRLIVGLNDDSSVQRLKGQKRPIKDQVQRALCLSAMFLVDAVCLFSEDTPINLIEKIRPEVLVKGGDYQIEEVVGANLVQSNGGQVHIVPLVPERSSTSYIEKMKS